MRVEELDEDERLAYIRHYDNDLNVTLQMRWWLIDTEQGLRMYDFEELSVGLRAMSLMGRFVKEGLSKGTCSMDSGFKQYRGADPLCRH